MVYDEPTVSKFKSNDDIHNFLYVRYKWFLFRFLRPDSYLLGLAALSDSSKLNEQV